ncbi:MAG: type VI secretion system membrane subunit TssM [Gammaproteobacteria bacterium]|nr:type VI secretion system membrane subunit TssM [Gammaproteobacteria bacterium]
MKKLKDFFKNRIVISIIGLIVLSLLIWFVGPAIKFGESNFAPLGGAVARLITIMVLLVAWGLNNLREQMKDKKQNNELVEDIQENKSDVAYGANPEEIAQINERFAQAMETLKKLKFKGRGSNKALYELPWYIIIGPPGSGKTTALINSSLDFPLAEKFGKGALQGVGGTRNCDWWFTNEAVLIDTAGRYTTQDSHKVADSSAWEGFLSLLKKNRRRRPINGAIVAISLQDLLTQSEEERLIHAKTIRNRIDELMSKLEIRFPVYLMFTKTDLVSGFTEFFEDLSKEEREQVWGVSLPNAPGAGESPDLDYLEAEFNALLKRLYDRVIWRMHYERDPKRRGAIQGFPQQIENLKPLIDEFVRQTFVKNRYDFQPYLRGIYFSSGTQDGNPIDRLMSSVSSSFGFARELVQQPFQQGKSFFLGQLFKDVIFPESELVGSNRKYEKIIRWSQRAAYAGMVTAAITMFVVWAGSFTRHEMFMNDVEAYIAEYHAENKRLSAWSNDIRAILPVLNSLANASVVYDQEEHPWLSGLGMYDGNVDGAADHAYQTKLRQLLLPKLLNYLESYLKQGHQGGDLYNTFRTYMMFNKLEQLDGRLVMEWFSDRWSRELRGQATKRKELEKHLGALLASDMKPTELNKRLVQSSRSLLLRVPVAKRVYSRVRTSPQYSQKVDLMNEFGETVRATYQNDDKIHFSMQTPLLFTIEGYENIDLSPDSVILTDVVNERWVLSDTESTKVDFASDDLGEISEKVKAHYLAEYRAHWENVFKHLEVKPFTGLRHANNVLTSFTDPVYSPILAILQVSSTNTQLSSQLLANLSDDNQEGSKGKLTAFAASKAKWTVVDKSFRDVNRLLRESKKSPAPVSTILQRIVMMQEFVNEITLAPDPGRKAFDVAKARYESGAGNPITSLRAYAKTMPQPVKRWLDSLASETWKVVLGSAHQYVNTEWKTKIYTPYIQGLAGRYPLKRSSRDELALADFTEFFKPGGTLDVFYQENLKPFVKTGTQWSNRIVDDYSLGLSATTVKQIQRAQNIKSIFFKDSPDKPSLSFQLKPYRMDKRDARFILEIGPKRLIYSHGPKFWKTVQWIGDDEHNRVRIIFEDLNEVQHTKTYEGPWAWFRLQDQSAVDKTRKSNVYMVTYNVDDIKDKNELSLNTKLRKKSIRSIRYQMKAKSVNNPFGKNLLASFKCPERI